MAHEITSKNIDGITDLVVVAPIREGFIEAYENVTYATRLRIVGEGLHRVRVAAREHEMFTPFSDVTQRILTLLDFRVGVIDKDLFAFPESRDKTQKPRIQAPRFLYLTATFDGPWEPYMRLIWDPLGPFLDLLFCNCEGYVTASEHSFDEYAQWVRDNQMDSAIFYSTTGLTVRDHLYLEKVERLQRLKIPTDSEGAIARLTMPDPEAAAKAERLKALKDLQNANDPDRFLQYQKIHELALEALTVLHQLANYYPPEWLAGQRRLKDGRYLVRAARDLLKGWEELIPTADGPLAPLKPDWDQRVVPAYRDPLHWYETGKKHLKTLDDRRRQSQPKDPKFDRREIQGGLLKPQGSDKEPVRRGALMLMTITDADEARRFIKEDLGIHYAEGDDSIPAGGYFRTIGFTAAGLRRMGLEPCLIDHFPKEFREGMEMRSGLLGDMRENHPRRWTLPPRNWPRLEADAGPFAKARPPVEPSEVDFVIQIRSTDDDEARLMTEIERLARLAANGAPLQSYQLMQSLYDEGTSDSRDHFGFRDGISQPRPTEGIGDSDQRKQDEVRLGEILLGYRNDLDDFAPARFSSYAPWRRKQRKKSLRYQFNGSFMVVRKLEQNVTAFNARIASETDRANQENPGLGMTPDRLKAKLFGRFPNGEPLTDRSGSDLNDFTYEKDTKGEQCPFAAHIRRANPRDKFQGRRAPRILRRGMSFDEGGKKGLIFMAYNARLAEQYETIQRWINGGNSTFVSASQNDPVLGVAPKTGALDKVERSFRFVEGNKVIRVTIPEQFVALHWGLYLFVPSRTALADLCSLSGGYRPMDEALEMNGRAVVRRMSKIKTLDQETVADEWKRLLEDFDAKDPTEKNISPDVWAAIRWYYGGAVKIEGGVHALDPWEQSPPKDQPMVLAASRRFVMRILSDWKTYSTEEQLRRIEKNSGPIFVTQQPDNQYRSTLLQQGKYNYRKESEDTNAILMLYQEADGFAVGYEAGKKVLKKFEIAAAQGRRDYYKIELRRQFLLPALGGVCHSWYGLPDNEHMHADGWQWQPPAQRNPPGPRCPGDFLSPSRNAFYPRPSETVGEFADAHGKAILEASKAFVAKHRALGNGAQTGSVAQKMFAAIPKDQDEVLARNLIGTMIGAIPPMDGNLRGILLEWLMEKTLWRHQAALRRALGDKPAATDIGAACATLYGPVSQAMCKRPAPDLLYRTALNPTTLPISGKNPDIQIKERDIVVVSLVSAAQWSLQSKSTPNGDVSIVFGGERREAYQPSTRNTGAPVHACPAQKMAMGAIMGILAALLEAGRITALPASLIVRISDWPKE